MLAFLDLPSLLSLSSTCKIWRETILFSEPVWSRFFLRRGIQLDQLKATEYDKIAYIYDYFFINKLVDSFVPTTEDQENDKSVSSSGSTNPRNNNSNQLQPNPTAPADLTQKPISWYVDQFHPQPTFSGFEVDESPLSLTDPLTGKKHRLTGTQFFWFITLGWITLLFVLLAVGTPLFSCSAYNFFIFFLPIFIAWLIFFLRALWYKIKLSIIAFTIFCLFVITDADPLHLFLLIATTVSPITVFYLGNVIQLAQFVNFWLFLNLLDFDWLYFAFEFRLIIFYFWISIDYRLAGSFSTNIAQDDESKLLFYVLRVMAGCAFFSFVIPFLTMYCGRANYPNPSDFKRSNFFLRTTSVLCFFISSLFWFATVNGGFAWACKKHCFLKVEWSNCFKLTWPKKRLFSTKIGF